MSYRGQRGRGRGRGRGSRGRGTSRGVSNKLCFSLDYIALEDVTVDPTANAHGNGAPRGRSQPRFPPSAPRPAFHAENAAAGPSRRPLQRGLGFATPALQDISNHSSGINTPPHLAHRMMLQPIKFIRGEAQELLMDPDAVLMQPGVLDAHRRKDSRTSVDDSQPTEHRVPPRSGETDLSEPRSPRIGAFDTAPTSIESTVLHATKEEDNEDDFEDIVYVPPGMQAGGPVFATAMQQTRPVPPLDHSGALGAAETSVTLIELSTKSEQPALAEQSEVIQTLPGKSNAAARKAAKRAKKKNLKKREHGEAGLPRAGDSDIDWGSNGPPFDTSPAIEELSRTLKERVIRDDREAEPSGMDVDDDLDDSQFAVSFVKSMAANVHITTDDIAIEQALRDLAEVDEKGIPWTSDTDASSASDAESIIQRVEDERWNGYGSDRDSSDCDSSVTSNEVELALRGAEDRRDELSNDSSDDDVSLEDKWDGVDELLDALPDASTSRSQRKKIFRAIESGNFEAFADAAVRTQQAADRKGKGKASFRLPGIDSEDELIYTLQAQWQADRNSKAARKKARAAARAEAGPSKKARKTAKRSTGDESNALASHDLGQIHQRIRSFAMDVSAGQALGLPPTNKRQRVAVHLLAEAYGLSSKSVGKGVKRAPILQRTARTAVHGVPLRKIQSIIDAAEGRSAASGGSFITKGRASSLWRVLDGTDERARASPVQKNREGTIVGLGADALDEGNIGFRLLARMGWNAGERIGVSGGLDEPLAATIKTSRRGLGH